jgi:Ca2+-binding EF-hand superfamily protein
MPSHNPRSGSASRTDGPAVPTPDTATTVTDTAPTTDFGAARGRGGPGGHGHEPLAALTITEVADQIFLRFDSDASGTISVSELLAVLDPDGDQAELPADLGQRLATVDTNSDSGVSKDELTTALTALDVDGSGTLDPGERPASDSDFVSAVLRARQHVGGPVEREPLTVTDAVDTIFTVFDTDGSDIISMDELLASLPSRGRKGGADTDTVAEQLVALIDSDGDGALSLAEVTATVTLLDTDLDGTLDSLHGAGDVALIGVLLHAHPVVADTVVGGGSLIA